MKVHFEKRKRGTRFSWWCAWKIGCSCMIFHASSNSPRSRDRISIFVFYVHAYNDEAKLGEHTNEHSIADCVSEQRRSPIGGVIQTPLFGRYLGGIWLPWALYDYRTPRQPLLAGYWPLHCAIFRYFGQSRHAANITLYTGAKMATSTGTASFVAGGMFLECEVPIYMCISPSMHIYEGYMLMY